LPGDDNPGCDDSGRCRTSTPVIDEKKLNGFWLVKPDGSLAAPYVYLSGKIRDGASAME
jgi:hypothetical protein